MFFNRFKTVLSSFFVLASAGLSMVAYPTLASPQEMMVTKEDFAEKKVYSPYMRTCPWPPQDAQVCGSEPVLAPLP